MFNRKVAGVGRRAVALAVLALGAGASPAVASVGLADEFNVWLDGAEMRALAGAAVADAGDVNVVFSDTCAEGSALQVALAPGRAFGSAAVGMSTFAAPPGTRIAGYELWRSLAAAPPELLRAFDYAAAIAESAAGASVPHGCSTYSESCLSAGQRDEPLAAVNRVAEHGTPLDAIALQVSCPRSWCQQPTGAPASAELYRARVQVDDAVAPAASVLAGDLAGGALSMAARATLNVSSSDAGAGIASIAMSIDGGAPALVSSGDTHPGCRAPYVAAPPCPTDVAHGFSVDAATLSAGAHTASGFVADAAGNTTAWGPVAFMVTPSGRDADAGPALGSPPVNGSPAVAKPVLRLRRSSAVRAPGTKASVTGTLRTARGEPVAGARLTLTARDLGVDEARTRRLAQVTTDARGRFRSTFRRDGAQRVAVAFAPRPDAQATARAAVTLRTRLSLTASPHPSALVQGRVLTMRGRLRGAGRSARGALVRVESIVNGEWTPVGVARARADGRCPSAAIAQPSARSDARAAMCVINRERGARGLRPLRWQPELAAVARRYSEQMVARGFFAHVSPTGADLRARVRALRYICGTAAWRVGETLAWQTGAEATAERVVAAWLDSPGHRRIILDPRFRDLGVGVAAGVPYSDAANVAGATYTAELGTRRLAAGRRPCRPAVR